MLTNEARREILNRVRASGFPGGISEAFKAAEQGVDVISQFEEQQSQQQEMQVANTPQQQETGLRGEHAQGNTKASMAFPDVQPNQSFNTVGMKAPIDIQKIDNQGHLVESYKNVPPGIQDLPTGPAEGTVIESPAAYQKGGLRNHMMDYLNTSGRDTNYVNIVMSSIAQHESKNNATQVQVSGNKTDGYYYGPGRGKYQFEVGANKGGNTAMNRTANFLKYNTNKNIRNFPALNKLYNEDNSLDFTDLNSKDQDALFIGDKIFGGVTRRNSFDAVTRNRTTPPSQEEVFQYWLKNHKGKVNGKKISELTKKEIEVERKKWNNRTKDTFQEGGLRFTTPLSLNRNPSALITRQPTSISRRTTNLEDIGENIGNYFNQYTNPTFIDTKKLNLSASSNIDPGVGWNPKNKSFSKYGSPTINFKGALGLNAVYRPTKKTTLTAGVNYATGLQPQYKAGLNFRLKRGGYRKKYL